MIPKILSNLSRFIDSFKLIIYRYLDIYVFLILCDIRSQRFLNSPIELKTVEVLTEPHSQLQQNTICAFSMSLFFVHS